MKKQNILLVSKQFKNVIENRKRIRNDCFTIYVKENDVGYLRVGLSVSKRIGKAHVRVKIRRQIRAIFDLLNIFDSNYDIVVVANPNFVEKDFQTLRTMLEKAVHTLIK